MFSLCENSWALSKKNRSIFPINTARLIRRSAELTTIKHSELITGKFMKKVLITSLLTLVAHQALADDHATETTPLPTGLYVGGGISYNNLDFGSIIKGAGNEATMGLQLFTGLPIENAIDNIETFAEVGFFRTNNFNFSGTKERVTGISGSIVLQRNLNEIDANLYGLGRIGLELGDDDGILMGIGAGYRIAPKVDVRLEFVNKDLISSYQANALVRF
jgi:hypothetical protein